MKFRLMHESMLQTSSIKSFIVKDKRVDNGYKMCSSRTYNQLDPSNCYGDLDFIGELALLIMERYMEDGVFTHSGEGEMSAEGSDLVVIMNHLNLMDIYIEAAHKGSDSWFSYSIYERLADIENI